MKSKQWLPEGIGPSFALLSYFSAGIIMHVLVEQKSFPRPQCRRVGSSIVTAVFNLE